MFFVSFWDIISSAAIALTTWPMPKDTIYPFEGKMYGTIATCEAQAFLKFLGLGYVTLGCATLNVYYVCSIRYSMSEERIKKVVLPIMFAIATAISVSLVTTLLLGDNLNPQPHDFGCSANDYPKFCSILTSVECIRGDASSLTWHGFVRNITYYILITLAIIIIASMCLVILTSYRTEMAAISSKQKNDALKTRRGNEEIKSSARDDFYTDDISISDSAVARMQEDAKSASPQGRPLLANTIIVSRQAGMYVGAFIITWVFTIMSFGMEDNWSVQILKCIFQPLQGFFNFLIFMYHKIHNVRRCNKDFGFARALKFVFQSPSEVPRMLLSKIDLVKEEERMSSVKSHSDPSSTDSKHLSDLLSLETPSVDLSNALSSNVMSYASSKEEPLPSSTRKYYDVGKLELPVEMNDIKLRTNSQSMLNTLDFGGDIFLEDIDEDAAC